MSASSKPRPILLVGNDQYGVLAAARGLRAAGYAPWLALDKQDTYVGRSRTVAGTVSVGSPETESEDFVLGLADAATRLSVSAVLPSAESHFLALAGRGDDFGGVAFGVPSPETVKWATDKALLDRLAAEAGLQTPLTMRVTHDHDELVKNLDFPVIVKPRRSRMRDLDGAVAAYNARLVSAGQLGEVLEAVPDGECLVQSFVTGSLISIAGVSWQGELACAMHQVSVRIWPMPVGGSSFAETIPPDKALEERVGRLLQAIGWSGIFQVQFIRSSSGEHYLIDFNPRVYGSLALAIAAGLNLPGIWADLLLGRRPNIRGYRVGVRYRQEEKDVRALARLLLTGHGDVWSALRGCLPHRHTTHAIFALDDPMPLLISVKKLFGYLKAAWTEGRMVTRRAGLFDSS